MAVIVTYITPSSTQNRVIEVILYICSTQNGKIIYHCFQIEYINYQYTT